MQFPVIAKATDRARTNMGYSFFERVINNEKEKTKFLQEYSAEYNVEFRGLTDLERKSIIKFLRKPIYHPNQIVRVLKITEHEDVITKETDMVKFSEYLKMSKYKIYGQSINLYPYKWYEKLYEIPFRIIYKFFLEKNSRLMARKPIQIATKIAIVSLEGIIGYYAVKIFILAKGILLFTYL